MKEKAHSAKKVIGQEAQLTQIVKKIFAIVIVGIIMLLTTFITSAMTTSAAQEQLDVTMALNQYRLGSKALTAAVQSYAVDGNTHYYDLYMQELNVDKNRDNALAILREKDVTKEEWALLDEIAGMSEGLVPLEESAMACVQAGDFAGAQGYVFGTEYEETVEKISNMTDSTIEQIQARLAGEQSVMMAIMGIAMLVFAAIVVVLLWQIMVIIKFAKTELLVPIKKVSEQMVYISRGDFNQELSLKADESEVGTMVSAIDTMKNNTLSIIQEVSNTLEQMGNGNYRFTLHEAYVGEYSEIKESFLKIGEKMRETIGTIKTVTEQIEAGSSQLACAAQDLAEGCTAQATQVTSVVENVQEMSDVTESTAKEAMDSVALSTKAGETLMEGNAKMDELVAAIGEISKCSEQISTIISAIEDIAEQTNLLSLNASIEAARAGEAGKGFAVVADQIRKLAEESSNAAKETTTLIEATVNAVDKGIDIAGQTAEDMKRVLADAKEATDKMNAISGLLEDEVARIQEINSTMVSISEVVNNNSASSEETAAVSEEQMAQVETMVRMMEQFMV
ncbi:MAG: methyl-accepting chemotaxis protein [Lachnospiraceae bacterium]|nr:methyl-accepting chemotaxis protein [Lachnospiraceae bacterium]